MNWTNSLLWIIYLALLGVLLPHTAWAFGQFEPEAWAWLGWVAAFAFEAAIAALTWRLKLLIETTPNYRTGYIWLRRLRYRYMNPYGLGLFVALSVSAIANWAHAVEFGRAFLVFGASSVFQSFFSVAFGAALPAVSLLFARVLAEATETELEANSTELEPKTVSVELRRKLREAEAERITAEEKAKLAEDRFAAVEELFANLFSEAKRDRILAAHQRWPALPASSISIITGASTSYISEVLKEENGEDDDGGVS